MLEGQLKFGNYLVTKSSDTKATNHIGYLMSALKDVSIIVKRKCHQTFTQVCHLTNKF